MALADWRGVNGKVTAPSMNGTISGLNSMNSTFGNIIREKEAKAKAIQDRNDRLNRQAIMDSRYEDEKAYRDKIFANTLKQQAYQRARQARLDALKMKEIEDARKTNNFIRNYSFTEDGYINDVKEKTTPKITEVVNKYTDLINNAKTDKDKLKYQKLMTEQMDKFTKVINSKPTKQDVFNKVFTDTLKNTGDINKAKSLALMYSSPYTTEKFTPKLYSKVNPDGSVSRIKALTPVEEKDLKTKGYSRGTYSNVPKKPFGKGKIDKSILYKTLGNIDGLPGNGDTIEGVKTIDSLVNIGIKPNEIKDMIEKVKIKHGSTLSDATFNLNDLNDLDEYVVIKGKKTKLGDAINTMRKNGGKVVYDRYGNRTYQVPKVPKVKPEEVNQVKVPSKKVLNKPKEITVEDLQKKADKYRNMPGRRAKLTLAQIERKIKEKQNKEFNRPAILNKINTLKEELINTKNFRKQHELRRQIHLLENKL